MALVTGYGVSQMMAFQTCMRVCSAHVDGIPALLLRTLGPNNDQLGSIIQIVIS